MDDVTLPSQLQLHAAATVEHEMHTMLDTYCRVFKQNNMFRTASSEVQRQARRALVDVQVGHAKAAQTYDLLRQLHAHAEGIGAVGARAAMAKSYVQFATKNKALLKGYGDEAGALLDSREDMDDLLQEVNETLVDTAGGAQSMGFSVDETLFDELLADSTPVPAAAAPFNSLAA
jgi:hypothetical protein